MKFASTHDRLLATIVTAGSPVIIMLPTCSRPVWLTVPLTGARFGRDPAIGSSVLLTFATDTLGFLIFLGLATMVLL